MQRTERSDILFGPSGRNAKACENCRTRRIKCEPPYPCRACRGAGLADCKVRAKPRLHRQVANTKTIAHSECGTRQRSLSHLEEELENEYEKRTGAPVSLALNEVPTHPLLDLSSPWPTAPTLEADAREALDAFIDYCLPFCGYISPARINDLFDRYATARSGLAPDRAALVESCLATGYVRLRYFGRSGRTAQRVEEEARTDVRWFRACVRTLEEWGSASFTAIHALSTLWFYSTLVADTDVQVTIASWLLDQGREVGLHQEQTTLKMEASALDQADLVFVTIIYCHYVTTSASRRSPILGPGEYDTIAFRSARRHITSKEIAVVTKPSMTELILLNTQLQLNMADRSNTLLLVDWALRIEERWAAWLNAWISEKNTTGNNLADLFVGILYHWGQLTLRAVLIRDTRFATSSLAVIARSCAEILGRYRDFYLTAHYNLVHQHLQHIVTCAHLVIYCFWRYAMMQREAEELLSVASWIIQLFEARWGDQALHARLKLQLVAASFGLGIPAYVSDPPAGEAALPEASADLGAWEGVLFQAGQRDVEGDIFSYFNFLE